MQSTNISREYDKRHKYTKMLAIMTNALILYTGKIPLLQPEVQQVATNFGGYYATPS